MRSLTIRRRTLRVAAAALTAAAGLTLTACSGGDAGTKAADRVDSAAVAQENVGSGASTAVEDGRAQGDAGTKGGPHADSAGRGATNSATAQSKRCHTNELKAAIATGDDAAPDPDAQGSTTTSVVLTNSGDRSCTLAGFPGVDVISESGEAWSLARSSAKYSGITLAPGETTDFTINVAMTDLGGDAWLASYLKITPPNETTSLRADWPWGPLLDQSGATHPATYVNPIG
ncbi:DUF4232 domain-containing protein [Streptomyces catenulae]|uniref:DUF4232 domain-containing protein n=1 Tax=Streptomyces catenulae TaxID=66875 RepID=A0ABV2YST0_9ACTN|nr:DUF4232 domain-containing protein [Streptomyces catenulae]